MDDNYQWIRELLYGYISKLEEKINRINDPIALHIIAYLLKHAMIGMTR